MKFAALAEKVTTEMIEALESGTAPWMQPWGSAGAARNYASGRAYTGFNQFYLSYLGKQYKTPYYLTFKQAQELGGHIRKGEKSFPVVYWLVKPRKTETVTNEQTGGQEERTIQKGVFLPFVYHVFNIDQVEGVDFEIPEIDRRVNDPLQACEDIVGAMPQRPVIAHRHDGAFYIPALDTVNMPQRNAFVSSEAYYATLFHELIHATGHPSRLDRFRKDREKLATDTREQQYGKEELVAEMGAAILCGAAGIANEDTRHESAAYLRGWIKTLRADNTLIIYAAAKAGTAAAYILGAPEEPAPPCHPHPGAGGVAVGAAA